MENLNWFTFIPSWVIQDLLVLFAGLLWLFFVLKNEKNPKSIILECVCFIFCYAAIYENLAGVMGWYGFGRSIVMIFNVPITVPLVEYLVVYTSIRLIQHTRTPLWAIPFFVGFMGMLFDFTLDPLAVRQVHETAECLTGIGRWSWFFDPSHANILNVTVYNFPGWVLLCGYSSAFILLGRKWFEKAKNKTLIGYLYPPVCLLAALLVMVSPLSAFLLWLGPMFDKGGITEWIMLAVWFIIPLTLLFIFGRKYTKPLDAKTDYLIFVMLIGFHVVNIFFALIGQYWEILPLQIGIAILQTAIVLFIYYGSRKAKC